MTELGLFQTRFGSDRIWLGGGLEAGFSKHSLLRSATFERFARYLFFLGSAPSFTGEWEAGGMIGYACVGRAL